MIKRIKIEGYKSFKSLDLKLSPVSVIFGPNASGKSNLLDAIQILSRMATCKTLGEAFEGHRGFPLESFYYGDVGFEEMLKRDKLEMSFEVDVQLSQSVLDQFESETPILAPGHSPDKKEVVNRIIHRFLRHTLSIEALAPTWRVALAEGEELLPIHGDGTERRGLNPILRRTWRKPKGPAIELRQDGESAAYVFSVEPDWSGIFPRLIPVFPKEPDSPGESTALLPFFPHLSAYQKELSEWSSYYLDPGIMRQPANGEFTRSIGCKGERLPAFLNVLEQDNPKSFDSFRLTLNMLMPGEVSIEIDRKEAGMVGLRLIENGVSHSSRLISDGTLRLMGLLAALYPKSSATVICVEEPENGVHPTRIRLIADILKNAAKYYSKQLIVTTHSPLFAEQFEDSQLFVCRKEDGQTTIEPFKPIGDEYRRYQIERALEDRIPRGDFGG